MKNSRTSRYNTDLNIQADVGHMPCTSTSGLVGSGINDTEMIFVIFYNFCSANKLRSAVSFESFFSLVSRLVI